MTRDQISKAKKEHKEFVFSVFGISISCKVISVSQRTSGVTIELLQDNGSFKKGDRLNVNAWEIKIKERYE